MKTTNKNIEERSLLGASSRTVQKNYKQILQNTSNPECGSGTIVK